MPNQHGTYQLTPERQLELKDTDLRELRADLADADKQIRNQSRYLNTLRLERVVVEQENKLLEHRLSCSRCAEEVNNYVIGLCSEGLATSEQIRDAAIARNNITEVERRDREEVSGWRRTDFGKTSQLGYVSDDMIETGKVRADAGTAKVR